MGSRIWMAAIATLLAAPLAAPAQTTVVDEGTFRLSVRGTAVGTETFVIRRSGTGAATTLMAEGRVVLDSGEQVRALLQLDGPALRPSRYQIEVAGPEAQQIRGQATGNRFRATIISSAGETMREYLAGEGAVVVDDGVAHQLYFLAARAAAGDAQVPVIVPRLSRQVAARVTTGARESIDIAGRAVSARRLDVQAAGMAARVVWVDDQNRVLRLRIPDEGFLAERTTLP